MVPPPRSNAVVDAPAEVLVEGRGAEHVSSAYL